MCPVDSIDIVSAHAEAFIADFSNSHDAESNSDSASFNRKSRDAVVKTDASVVAG
jgi:hypothetical protein